MRTRNRLLLGTVSVAAAVGLLAGCTSGTPASQEKDITLRMTMWSSNPAHLALFQGIADDFMKVYPAVTSVKLESLTLDQLDTVMTTQISAGDPPDISWLPVESSKQYISNGALLDLSKTLKAYPDYDFADLIPGLQERWTDGDALYGVPFSTGPLVMYYNKDLYAKAGVKSPEDLIADGTWTWEAFAKTSKELKDKLDLPGYVLTDFDFKNWTRLLPIMDAYGASPWDHDAEKCTADSPKMADALSLFHDMVFKDHSSPLPGQTVDFFSGQAGATTGFLGSTGKLKDATFKWGMVPTPAGPAGSTQAVGQAAIVALAAGKHKEAAEQFLAFMTTKESAAKLAEFFPPTRASVLTPDVIAATSPLLTPELVTPIVDALKSTGQVFPVAKDNSKVADALNSTLDQYVYQPNADIPASVKKICDAIGPLL